MIEGGGDVGAPSRPRQFLDGRQPPLELLSRRRSCKRIAATLMRERGIEPASVGKQTIIIRTLSTFVGGVAGLRLALLAAALLGGCGGGSGDKTFEGDGYSFTYPGGWEQYEGSGAPGVGRSVSSVAFAPTAGGNGLTLTVYRLPAAITEDNIGSFAGEIRTVTEQVFHAGGGRLLEGPTRVNVAGLPAFTASGTGVTPSGTRVRSRIDLAFDGTTEYFFNCQFTFDHAEEIQQGCSTVLESFQLGDT